MNSPVPAESQITQADALLSRGALVAARQLLENVVQITPDHRDALLRLVDIDLVEKKIAAARYAPQGLPSFIRMTMTCSSTW